MITKQSTFEEVFGDYSNAYTPEDRKERWEQYKNAIGKKQALSWSDIQVCKDCTHLDDKEAWCNYIGLPCTVNPCFGFGMIGMACAGVGFEKQQLELSLFTSNK